MNITKVTGLFVEIPLLDGEGSVCLVVSASVAVGCGPGKKKQCHEKVFLPQHPHPHFKL